MLATSLAAVLTLFFLVYRAFSSMKEERKNIIRKALEDQMKIKAKNMQNA